MTYSGQIPVTHSFQAAEDLSSHEYFAIALDDRKVANNGKEASGILLTTPKINEHGSIALVGVSKFQAGGAIGAGGAMTVATSGYMTAAGSGDFIVGRNLDAAVTSGSVGVGMFDFSKPVYAFSSSFA